MSKLIIIRNVGGSRVISVTKFLPKEWEAVEVTEVKSKSNSDVVTLKISKVK